jgi:hypothetical protein
MPHDSTESGAFRFKGLVSEAEMFLWSGRQAVFVLVMLFVCAMALTHPVWRHWYELIFPLCASLWSGVGLRHAKVRQVVHPGVKPPECGVRARTVEHSMTNRGPREKVKNRTERYPLTSELFSYVGTR